MASWKKRVSKMTGRRVISHLLREGVTGIASVSRTDDLVVLNLYGILPPEPVSTTLVDVFASGLPLGYRPDASMAIPLTVTMSSTPPFLPRVFMQSTGTCRVNTPGGSLYGVVTYRTNDPWPEEAI